MATLQFNCPRCGTKAITFDVLSGLPAFTEYEWKSSYELFSKCRRCSKATTIIVSLRDYDSSKAFDAISKVLNFGMGLDFAFDVNGYVSLKDDTSVASPEHLPEAVEKAFREGAVCLTVGCYNASGTMFRLAIDLATKSLLPSGDGSTGGPNRQQRTQLASRLDWLFTSGGIPESLRQLANCVRDDGNDGAHDGTLTKEDAADLLDFATVLFKRMFTEPEQLRRAELRRVQRRS